VFQDYALFPHLTVEKNLLYGLRIQKKPDDEARALMHQTARLLGIAHLLERYPHELSGGQQQRVALGRALVLKPLVLLMDEPLSSLDAKLRALVRDELQDIQRDLGVTTMYVTHDQEEALSLSDCIAVINHGSLQQVGSPQEVYFSPRNAFVADFVGRANFIERDGTTQMIRPEWLAFVAAGGDLTGTVLSASFFGGSIRYRIQCDGVAGGVVIMDERTRDGMAMGAGQVVHLAITHAYTLP
ncbi:MAG: ABC transporter ATP-binding protein, partial [Treponemataceae bacterium]|nr:ABC transporter ATP-binding protein [Treponemataceae bacterium]